MTKNELKQLTVKVLKKWEDIINGGDETGCAYCKSFSETACWTCSLECPICFDTSVAGCKRTPYLDWSINKTTQNAWLEYMYLENIAYSQGIHPEQDKL